MDFPEKTQSLVMEMDDMNMIDVSGNAVLPMDFENFDLDALLASISSENSCDWNLKSSHDESTKDLFSSQEDSFSLGDQLKDMNSLIGKNLCFDDWSGEVSSFDLLKPVDMSGIIAQEVAEENAFASSNVLVDMSEEFLNFTSMDDLCQWFGPSPKDSTNTLSESIEFNSTFSDLVGGSDIPMHSAENDILDSKEFDLGFDLAPVVSAATDTGTSTRKRLFSELEIEDLLKGEANYNPLNSSNFVNELSTNKGNVVEFSPMYRTPIVHFGNLAGAEEPTQPTKKRARPGESTRPRPKDRQQIQDCLKELRGIIPNSGKCSIDSLLDRTVRYLIFLRSVVKYADMLTEPNGPKLIEQLGNGVEVENQTIVCPIIVEDRTQPGQMLIEMLCEEQSFFLEIVDIIRGFGLHILKGKMEIRNNKLWARFIVEANRHVTRIDVFWSLIHLLQQTNTSAIDSSNKQCNVIDSNIS